MIPVPIMVATITSFVLGKGILVVTGFDDDGRFCLLGGESIAKDSRKLESIIIDVVTFFLTFIVTVVYANTIVIYIFVGQPQH